MNMPQPTPISGQDATLINNNVPEFSIKRLYGPVGFERFDHIYFEPLSAGSATIGKVIVDCKLLFRKSLWGILYGKSPAGILYLDLGFVQPPGHCLKAATVTVRLKDEHGDDQEYQQNQSQLKRSTVYFGQIGPNELRGVARLASKTRTSTLKPEVKAGPAEVSDVGVNQETQTEQEHRWKFSGKTEPDPSSESNLPANKLLRWRLVENKLEKQPSHSDTIHTAFSFHHSGQPFSIHISIEGQLRNRLSNFKTKIWTSQSDTSTTTILVKPGQPDVTIRPLDELVENLDDEMCLMNRRAAPVEIPTVKRTAFQGVKAEKQTTTDTSSVVDGIRDQQDEGQNNRPTLNPTASQGVKAGRHTMTETSSVVDGTRDQKDEGQVNQDDVDINSLASCEANYEAKDAYEESASGTESNEYVPTAENLAGLSIILTISRDGQPPVRHSKTPSSSKRIRETRTRSFLQ
ncbi:hypothetical protein E8E14_010233 [Neopestalotiopsis sp. 37M]|nr:hypothetical protein E8E14_010233 [Neopestalotiopsis sp. 37M]